MELRGRAHLQPAGFGRRCTNERQDRQRIIGAVGPKGVKRYRSKSTKGNPGLSGIHLFWAFHPAVYLFPAGRRRGSRHLFRPAPVGRQRGSGLDVHSRSRALRGLRLFQIPRDDSRKAGLGMVQVGIFVPEETGV